MMGAAVADIEGPAVTADDPDAAPDQMINHRQKIQCVLCLQRQQACFQFGNPVTLRAQLEFLNLRRVQQVLHKTVSNDRCQPLQQRMGHRDVLVGGDPEAHAELGVVLEQRVRPGGAAAFMIFGPRRYGQAAAIDGGTACGVGDLGTIAEQLGQKLEIRCFAAARASAGEFEQRFEQLDASYIGEIDPGTVIDREFFEERHAGLLGLQQRSFLGQIDRLLARLAWADRRAGLDAETAAGAILDMELQGETLFRIAARVHGGGLEGRRRAGQRAFVIGSRTDHAVGADKTALAALDTEILFPYRDRFGDIALFVGGGTGRKGTVRRDQADRYIVAASHQHRCGHVPDEVGRIVADEGYQIVRARRGSGNIDLEQLLERAVHGLKVHLYYSVALAAVGLADRLLDVVQRLLAGQYARYRKKAGLEHRVGADAEPDVAGDLRSIDDEKTQFLVDDLLLHRKRQFNPGMVLAVRAIQQGNPAGSRDPQRILALEECKLVACDESC